MKAIKTALCSFGLSGRVFHAPFLHINPSFELYAVLERTEKKANKLYPSIISYASIDDLLNDAEVELVIVNTPNYTHFEFAQKALNAGKHVLIEKPFACSVQEAETLVALSKEKNRFLTVYHNRRFDSDFKTVKKIIDKGFLGELVYANFRYERYRPVLSAKQHKEGDEKGGGIVYDLGPHIIDQALSLFGMPKELFAHLSKQREGSEVVDAFQISLFYESLTVELHGGFFNREPVPSYVLQGKKGSFIKHRGDVQETLLEKGVQPIRNGWAVESAIHAGHLHTEYSGTVINEKTPSEIGNYMEFFDQLAYAIRHQAPFNITAEDGLQSIKIIEAAYLSHEQKKVITLH
ncbi:Gfo/Idh/MocA family oxidoreductase [Gynurincola endophyticus]|uniref:Gfo/Idh/MocA family oxidoreductase n=1 Tax=Gynurincola endophyticus TaxID=2479004 RepID=UPI000F8D1089|nr:Gfo/Idh/MocA family oxidoreductase [Gynurincola endophyticus]